MVQHRGDVNGKDETVGMRITASRHLPKKTSGVMDRAEVMDTCITQSLQGFLACGASRAAGTIEQDRPAFVRHHATDLLAESCQRDVEGAG